MIWVRSNKKLGNIHQVADQAVCKKIPFSRNKAWYRNTSSDVSRVNEYILNNNIGNSYMYRRLIQKSTTTLIDLGANIGLQSLSLIEEFKSIKKVIGVEPELENYKMLVSNYKLWNLKFRQIDFSTINGAISHSSDIKLSKVKSLYELNNKSSASGTFRYQINNEKNPSSFVKAISIQDLVDNIPANEKIIIKIDIEGGEEHLFKENLKWLERTLYLTCELHDTMHPLLINSSKNMIKALVDANFAFTSVNNVIHCYNRDILSD